MRMLAAHAVERGCDDTTDVSIVRPASGRGRADSARCDLRGLRQGPALLSQLRHFDERYNNQCTETDAEPVTDKTRRNFCEYFYFSRAAFVGASAGSDRAAEARVKLEALFKKKSPDAN